MPTAFTRSPADSLAGITGRDKLRSKTRRRGGLRQEDRDQPLERVGPQKESPNMVQNRDITFGSGNVRPQDTKTGTVGLEPNRRDEAGGVATSTDTGVGRDKAGSAAPTPSDEDGAVQPMSEGEVQSAVHKMVWDAIEYIDQELSPFRALATKYYQGEPFGNEEEGRSQVVMTELRDTVLMILPSLMRIFFGAERSIEYAPMTAQQLQMAEQATEYVWEVVLKKDNRGFLVFYEWFKDALVKRLGIVKYWFDKSAETRSYSISFVSDDALTLLYDDATIHVDSVSPQAGSPPGVNMYEVEYTKTRHNGGIRMIALPPEEFLFTRGARTTASDHSQPGVALFVGHRTELTRSQLLEIGVSEQDIEDWAFKDVSLDHNQEEIARQHIVKPDTSAIGPIATQKSLYIEGYPFMDVDGDGVAELRKIVMLGPSYHVIENEPADERPFAVLCPDPEPHTIIGQGTSDLTMDLQRINSMIMRSMLDSLSLSIHNRIAYVEGDVNMEDVMNTEIGAPIRMRAPNSISPIEHRFVGADALPVLEKMDQIKENRVGVTKASAGLAPDAMQSTTQAAVAATVSKAQEHIEMTARTFAETGVTQLFRGILKLLVENQDVERLVKVAGNYVPMNPVHWSSDLDVEVKVAIGAGMDDEKYRALAETAAKMEGIMGGPLGLGNPLVSMKQYRDTLVRMLKLRGRNDAEAFYKDVDPNWQPPPPPPQDPNMVIAQAEQKKADAEVAKKQADAALDQARHQAEQVKKMAEVELQRQKMLMEDARAREQMAQTVSLKIAEINAQYGTQIRQQDIDESIKREKTRIDAAVKVHIASQQTAKP